MLQYFILETRLARDFIPVSAPDEIKRLISWAGHLFFLILGVFAFLFFKERAFYVDAGHHLFSMINAKSFAIPHLRYSVISYQWLPVLAIRMNCSLYAVALLFSLSPVLWAYAAFLYGRYVLNDLQSSVAILLVSSLLTRETFYCVYEIWPGLVLLPLLLSHLNRLESRHFLRDMIPATLLLIVCLFVHLTVVLSAAFILAYWIVLTMSSNCKRTLIVVASFLLLAFIRFQIIRPGQYEEGLLPDFQTILERARFFADSPLNQLLGHLLWSEYYIFSALLVLLIALLAARKRWLEGVCIIGFLAGYVFALHITLPGLTTLSLHELRYLGLAVMVAVPFAGFLQPEGNSRRIRVLIAIIVVSAITGSLIQIERKHTRYKNILRYKEKITNYAAGLPERKLFWDAANVNRNYIDIDWAFPEETMLLSAFQGRPAVTICIADPALQPQTGLNKFSFVRFFEVNLDVTSQQYFNKRYFKFEPGFYAHLNTAGSFSDLEYLHDKGNIDLHLIPEEKPASFANVRIRNWEKLPVFSSMQSTNPTSLWYRRNCDNGKTVERMVPLEVDIHKEYFQQINLPAPELNASCTLEVDLYGQGIGRWHAGEQKLFNSQGNK